MSKPKVARKHNSGISLAQFSFSYKLNLPLFPPLKHLPFNILFGTPALVIWPLFKYPTSLWQRENSMECGVREAWVQNMVLLFTFCVILSQLL